MNQICLNDMIPEEINIHYLNLLFRTIIKLFLIYLDESNVYITTLSQNWIRIFI